MDIYDFLERYSIPYLRFDHPRVYTVAQANLLRPGLPGKATKNLFLQDKKGRRYFLLVCNDQNKVDLKQIAKLLGVSRLSFASGSDLSRYLGIEAGAASILALINDLENHVELIIQQEVWQADAWLCHPLVNTTTLSIPTTGIQIFLQALGKTWRVVDF